MENEEENVDLEEVNETGTSESEVETTNEQEQPKTYSEEEVEAIKKQMKEDNQKAWNKRWGQEKSKMEREYAKKDELTKLLLEQTQSKNIDDLLNISYEQYGIERPSISNSKDDEILGKYDAKEILELDDDSIEAEANRLANMKRSAREEATFMELGNYLTNKKVEAKRKQEIKEVGIDETTLNDEGFKKFADSFKEDTPMKFIYETYSKMNNKEKKKEKPFSAGSLKGANKDNKNEIKEFYTYEESLQFTREDFNKNPKLFEAVERSMQRWGK